MLLGLETILGLQLWLFSAPWHFSAHLAMTSAPLALNVISRHGQDYPISESMDSREQDNPSSRSGFGADRNRDDRSSEPRSGREQGVNHDHISQPVANYIRDGSLPAEGQISSSRSFIRIHAQISTASLQPDVLRQPTIHNTLLNFTAMAGASLVRESRISHRDNRMSSRDALH